MEIVGLSDVACVRAAVRAGRRPAERRAEVCVGSVRRRVREWRADGSADATLESKEFHGDCGRGGGEGGGGSHWVRVVAVVRVTMDARRGRGREREVEERGFGDGRTGRGSG